MGEWVIKPQFDYVEFFSEGLAVAKTNGKCGFIDKTGKFVIATQFDYADSFRNGLANVMVSKESESGLVDTKWFYIDKDGKFITNPRETSIPPYEGLITRSRDGKWGFVDKTGLFVINPHFEYASEFREGLAVVEKNGKIGFIDKTGQFIFKTQFESAENFSEGVAQVRKNGKYGFIDKTGQFVFNFNYSNNAELLMPDLIGIPLDEGEAIIRGANLKLGSSTFMKNGSREIGTIVRQDPHAGKQIAIGGKVDLWIIPDK